MSELDKTLGELTNQEFNEMMELYLQNTSNQYHLNFVLELTKEATGYSSLNEWFDDHEDEAQIAKNSWDDLNNDNFWVESEVERFIDSLDSAVMALDFKQFSIFGDFYEDFVNVTAYTGSMDYFQHNLRRSTTFFEFAVATIMDDEN